MDVSIIGGPEHVRPPMTRLSADSERNMPALDPNEGCFRKTTATTDPYPAAMTCDSLDEPHAAKKLETISHVHPIADGGVLAGVVGARTANAVQPTAGTIRDSDGSHSVLSDSDRKNVSFRNATSRQSVEPESAV